MLGILAIAGKNWLILVDEKSHNSISTGAYAAWAEAVKRFKQNDMNQLRAILEKAQGCYGHILVVVEGLHRLVGSTT